MSGTQQTQAQHKRDGFPPADQQAGQQTWEGGGREPIDPDDVGEDGENAGNGKQMKQQLRSDDN